MSRKTERGRHRNRRISATELAALGRCEQQAMFKHHRGAQRIGHQVAAARRCGNAEHARRHEAVKRLANAPSDLDSASSLDTVRQQDHRCLIATAVYGNHVWQTDQLRAWRDRALLAHRLGCVLVRAYYRLSPPLARLLKRPRATRLIRRVLDRYVSHLDAGVRD